MLKWINAYQLAGPHLSYIHFIVIFGYVVTTLILPPTSVLNNNIYYEN